MVYEAAEELIARSSPDIGVRSSAGCLFNEQRVDARRRADVGGGRGNNRGFGGNGNRKPGIYVDSDLRIGVLKATLPPRASYCSSAFLDQADASAIEAFLLEMQRAIPNRAFLEVRSYCKDDLRVRVDVRGPQSQSRLFDYPISEECVGDGTVPTWLLSLVDRVRAYEDAVARCVSVEPATEGVAAPRR